MIIGIDGNEANVTEQVGVSVYTLNVLQYFHKKAGSSLQFNIFLRDEPLPHLPKQIPYFTYITVSPKWLWSQLFLPFYLLTHRNIDIFFSPAHYAPRFSPAPSVVTIHDLSYFYYPQDFLKEDLYKLKYWTKYSVRKAKKVIAVSQNTKQDLTKFYSTPQEKIEVVFNGYERKIKNPQGKSQKLMFVRNNPYILYVGTLQPRKNIPTLIKAFKLFSMNNPQFQLVITGKKGWLYDEIFNEVRNQGLEQKIIFTGYVPDEELPTLYKNAFCFVLPSLYEGFGIPLLEAMSFKCPVISSNTSSLPEIGGDACLYFDPRDENELVEKLEKLKDSKLRDELSKKGSERIKLFSWEKCATQTLEVIKTAYHESSAH